jgi:hypothetical protein
MARIPCVSIVLAVLFGALSAPAQATYAAQLGIAGGPQTNVACPVKVPFSGAVIGMPGVPFQYWFITLVNGVEQVTPKTTMTMPMTGVAPVTYPLTITNSSDQTTTNIVELDASDLSGQARPTASTQVKYFVTCRTSTTQYHAAQAMGVLSPTPAPRWGGASGLGMIVPTAPKGMAATQDPQACAQHMGLVGGLVCQTGLSTGALALVWNSAACDTCFDGYHLYRVDSGRHDLLQTQPDKTLTGTILGREAGPFTGRCYAVTAYQAKFESADSNPACIGGGQIQVTGNYRPMYQRSPQQRRIDDTGLSGTSNSNGGHIYDMGDKQLIVGFNYMTDKRNLGDHFENTVNRMGLLFDLSNLRGKTVTKAVLHLFVEHSIVGRAYAVDHSTSCATRIGAGVDRWWQYSDQIAGPGGPAVSSTSGPDVDIDVTQFVQSWTHNTNFGFVLYGADENLNAFTENSCQTWYRSASSLDVTHY